MREIAQVLTTVNGSRIERAEQDCAWTQVPQGPYIRSGTARVSIYVLRDREVFPNRSGKKFYCCPKCTAKLHECVSVKVSRYIDHAKWKAEIESDHEPQYGQSRAQPDVPFTLLWLPSFSRAG